MVFYGPQSYFIHGLWVFLFSIRMSIRDARCSAQTFVPAIQRNRDWQSQPRVVFGGMKIKTSITLSNEVLKAIDLYIGEYRSRSEFIETATRKFIAQLARKEAERKDLELINRHSDSLNAEAEDVLTYQVPL